MVLTDSFFREQTCEITQRKFNTSKQGQRKRKRESPLFFLSPSLCSLCYLLFNCSCWPVGRPAGPCCRYEFHLAPRWVSIRRQNLATSPRKLPVPVHLRRGHVKRTRAFGRRHPHAHQLRR